MEDNKTFHTVKLPEGSRLRKKETFEYITPNHIFDVELFENQDGSFYSIGIPREAERLMVFGTRETTSAHTALQALVDKIRREENLIDPSGDETSIPGLDEQ